MKCSNCGYPILPDVRECPNCGLRIGSAPVPAPRPDLVPAPSPRPNQLRPPDTPSVGLGGRGRRNARRPAGGGLVGTVVSEPVVTGRRTGTGIGSSALVRVLGLLVLVLVFPYVLVQLTVAFLPLILLMLLGFWVLGRVGLGGLVGGALFSRGRRNSGGGETPWLMFRLDGPDGIREVELEGHDYGVELGDDVAVTGIRRRGAIRAVRVQNLTNQRTLYADGLVTKAVSALAVIVLVLLLIGSRVTG